MTEKEQVELELAAREFVHIFVVWMADLYWNTAFTSYPVKRLLLPKETK